MKVIISIFIILIYISNADEKYNSLFINGGYNSISTNGDLNQVGNIIDCEPYFANDGSALQVALGFRYNIYKSIFVSPYLAYSLQNSYIFERENTFNSRNDISLFIESVNTRSALDVTNQYFSPGLNFNVSILELDKSNLEFMIGSFYRFNRVSTFEQYEEIKSPSNASFINHDFKQKRNINSGDANFLNEQLLISGGLMYRINLEPFAINFGTQIAFSPDFLIKENEITNTELTVFLGLEYQFIPGEEVIEYVDPPMPNLRNPVKPIDDVIVNETFLKDSFNLEITNDIYKDLVIYEKEELLASTPLVNSIFYEQNNADIPTNYIVSDVYDSKMLDNIIEAHNVVVPRILKILKENPNSKINLIAYHLENKEDRNIPLERINNLIKILNKYGIYNNRINSEIVKINEKKFESEIVLSENYRVDLKLIDAELQKYVKISKYKELDGKINFDVDYFPDKSADLFISLDNKQIPNIEKKNNSIDINKKISENEDLDFYAKLSGSQSEKIFYFNLDKSKINTKNKDLDYNNFEAILRFDFNSAELSNENKVLLEQLYEIIPENVGIKILGSADAVGDNRVNERLEVDRAKNTKNFLESINQKNIKIETGRSLEKFPEETPQGRFLNRSIRIKLIVD